MGDHFLLKAARRNFSQRLTMDPLRPRGSEKESGIRKPISFLQKSAAGVTGMRLHARNFISRTNK
jgi:hypothetical protein